MARIRNRRKPVAEMNVVPYIDVMLVLLVIFMVTAPMLVQGVNIELPKVAAEALPTENERKLLTLSVKADGSFYWNLGSEIDIEQQQDSAVELAEMRAKVESLIAAHGDAQVYVRADEAADYGRVVAAIAELQRGGVVNLGLITEAPDTMATGAGRP